MNAFSDLLVTFGEADEPTITRLGNQWELVNDEAGIRTSAGTGASAPAAAAAQHGPWSAWAVGDVFAYRNSTTDPLVAFVKDLANGSEAPRDLDMHAAVFAWDTLRRELHVWVNRMGTVHVYVGGQAGRRRVGTPFAAVAEVSSLEPDWIGITGFCGVGFYVADRTPFNDVRILRPATHTVFDAEGEQVSQRRYWDWWYEPKHGRPADDLVDEFHEIWESTLARQVADRTTVVPVSGGLDSRTIVAGLTSQPTPVTCLPALFTYGYADSSVETRIARGVARARGLPIREMTIGRYLCDRVDEVIGSVEGFQALTLSRQIGASAVLAGMGERVVGGHWGDVWFDGSSDPSAVSNAGLVDMAMAKFSKRGSEWLFDRICRPNLGGVEPSDVLRDVLRSEIERLPDLEDVDMRLKALKTEQWSFRWTLASVRAYQLAQPTLMPFYANDLVDFFLRVPTSALPGRRLQKAYLCRHHPDLARVRWQDSGMSLFEHRWEPSAAFARRALAKGVRTARRRTVTERNWELQYHDLDRTGRLAASLLGTLPGEPVESQVTDDLLLRLGGAPDPAAGHAFDTLLTIAGTFNAAGRP